MDFDGKAAMSALKSEPVIIDDNDDFVKRVAPRVVEGITRLKAFVIKHK